MKVALGTLKDKGELLVTFLEPRVGTRPLLAADAITIEDESVREGVKPRQVKTYIKRFLYMNGVRKNYRVFVSGKELTIQEIELGEKEEEEEKPEKKPEQAPTEAKKGAEETPEEEAPKSKAEKPEKTKRASKKPRAKKKKSG